jgi:hypothetical protein
LGAAKPDEVVEESGLPGSVSSHDRHHLALMEVKGDVRECRDRPVSGGEALHPGDTITSRCRGGQTRACLEAVPEFWGLTAGVSDREGNRRPSGHTGEADDRWRQLRRREDRRRRAAADIARAGTDLDDDVRELHDALEAVLGYQDGGALVVYEARE